LAQLNQVTQQNASSSEELASASTNFNTQSGKLKDTVSFFKLDKKGEVLYQRERIISQIEQLKSILNETDGEAANAKVEKQGTSSSTNTKISARTSAKNLSLEDDFGGPSIQLDDFDSMTEVSDGNFERNGSTTMNGSSEGSGKVK
jgi:methyl-accepting chemotaxis protein